MASKMFSSLEEQEGREDQENEADLAQGGLVEDHDAEQVAGEEQKNRSIDSKEDEVGRFWETLGENQANDGSAVLGENWKSESSISSYKSAANQIGNIEILEFKEQKKVEEIIKVGKTDSGLQSSEKTSDEIFKFRHSNIFENENGNILDSLFPRMNSGTRLSGLAIKDESEAEVESSREQENAGGGIESKSENIIMSIFPKLGASFSSGLSTAPSPFGQAGEARTHSVVLGNSNNSHHVSTVNRIPVHKIKKICSWHNVGFCRRRSKCRDLHPPLVCNKANCNSECGRRHPQPCRFWPTRPGCLFGDKCAYAHGKLTEDDEPVDLPEELLFFILSLLPYKSLSNSALVSTKWHRVATDPSLWKDKVVSLNDDTFHLLGQVLRVPRLARVTYLDLRLDFIMPKDKDMLAIQQSKLDMLEMDWSDLSLVDSKVLAKTILKSRQTDVIHFDAKILLTLLATDTTKTYKLEQLQLNQTDLESVEVEMFTKAVAKLTTLLMSDTQRDVPHLTCLFQAMAEQTSSLTRLSVAGTAMRELEISEDMLALSLNKLEVAEVEGMNSRQVAAFFHFDSNKSKLQRLDLNQCDFSLVSQALFVSRLNRLQKLDLQFCEDITLGQMRALITSKNSNLKHLVLSNSIDLSDIEPELLAGKVVQLSRMEMNHVNNLASAQVDEIFNLLDNEKKSLSLRKLGLSGVDVSSVPMDRAARVLNKLEWANLSRAKITCCQLKRTLLGPDAFATKLMVLNVKGLPILSHYHWSDLVAIAKRIPIFAYRLSFCSNAKITFLEIFRRSDQCGHTLEKGPRKDFADNDLHNFLASH